MSRVAGAPSAHARLVLEIASPDPAGDSVELHRFPPSDEGAAEASRLLSARLAGSREPLFVALIGAEPGR